MGKLPVALKATEPRLDSHQTPSVEENEPAADGKGLAEDSRSPTSLGSSELALKEKETVVLLVEQEEKDLASKSAFQEASASGESSEVISRPELNGQRHISLPGAWSSNPPRVTNHDEDDSVEGVENTSGIAMDEEIGTSSTTNGQILVNAELVEEEERTIRPDLLVDATMIDEDPKLVAKRKSRQQRLRIIFAVVLVGMLTAILLAVLLTRNNSSSGSSALQQTTVIASSSPTVSIPPSTMPTSSPSLHPSDVPSQSPTSLGWEQVQSLDDSVFLGFDQNSGLTVLGGQQFGQNVHVSDIANTLLANRTDKHLLVAVEYGDAAQFSFGAFLFQPTGVGIYLCGDNNNTTNMISMDRRPPIMCEFVHLVDGDTVQDTALAGTTLAMISSLSTDSYQLFDLTFVDIPAIPLLDEPLSDISLPKSVSVSPSGDKVVILSNYEKLVKLFGASRPPPLIPPDVGSAPPLPEDPAPPLPIGPGLSDPFVYADGSGVLQTLPPPELLGDSMVWVEAFEAIAMTDFVIITIHSVQHRDPLIHCVPGDVCLFGRSYKIYRTNMLLEDMGLPFSFPPDESEDSYSIFSKKGLAINDDATIVAVSSATLAESIDNNGTDPKVVEFGIDVFQLTNSTTWEPMGSRIWSPSPGSGDYFGSSLAMDSTGTFLIAGAPYDDGDGLDSGKVYAYEWDGEDWVMLGDALTGPSGSQFGTSVAISPDGRFLIVGAPASNKNGDRSGEVFTYVLQGNSDTT